MYRRVYPKGANPAKGRAKESLIVETKIMNGGRQLGHLVCEVEGLSSVGRKSRDRETGTKRVTFKTHPNLQDNSYNLPTIQEGGKAATHIKYPKMKVRYNHWIMRR